MSRYKKDMKNYQYINFKTIDFKRNNQKRVYILNRELKDTLKERIYLQIFFNFLEENKIRFEIIRTFPNSAIFLKILTLEPKYFMIIINETNIRNCLVNYDELNLFLISLTGETNSNSYIIYLDPNIKSTIELKTKSKYIRVQNLSLKQEFERIKNTNVKILIKKELRKGLPLGKYSKKNKLNELTGKEWIKFTKSWFIYNPPPRKAKEIFHPAKFPESLIESFIRFFTKERELVLDPFLGTGSTTFAAKCTIRSCIGIEINKNYVQLAKSRLTQQNLDKWVTPDKASLIYKIYNDDSNKIEKIWKDNNLPFADLCITSPPYWNQLKRDHIRQEKRKPKGLATRYSENPFDIGNLDDYNEFIIAQKNIFDKVYNVVKKKGYLILITNNVYYKDKMYPLAFDTAISLSNKWILKDERIWCQDNKQLIPLGVNNAYVGNRHHVYCLIFRKEEI